MRRILPAILALGLLVCLALAQSAEPVTVSWVASPTPGVTYNVYRATGACTTTGQASVFSKRNAAPIAGLGFDDTADVQVYCFGVTAVLNGIESPMSPRKTFTLAPIPPDAVDVVRKTPTKGTP